MLSPAFPAFQLKRWVEFQRPNHYEFTFHLDRRGNNISKLHALLTGINQKKQYMSRKKNVGKSSPRVIICQYTWTCRYLLVSLRWVCGEKVKFRLCHTVLDPLKIPNLKELRFCYSVLLFLLERRFSRSTWGHRPTVANRGLERRGFHPSLSDSLLLFQAEICLVEPSRVKQDLVRPWKRKASWWDLNERYLPQVLLLTIAY